MSDHAEQQRKAEEEAQFRDMAGIGSWYEPRLRSMRFEDGKFEMEIEPDAALQILSELCVKALANAPNFQTAEVFLQRSGEGFNVTVERIGAKSVVQTLKELRAEVERLKSELQRECERVL